MLKVMENLEPLTSPERQLLESVQRGVQCDFSASSEGDDGADRGDDHRIRAAVLQALLSGDGETWGIEAVGGINVRGAHIWGELGGFEGSQLPPVRLEDCRFDKVDFNGAIFTGEARFNGAIFTGEARFDWATFTGEARFNGATFRDIARFKGAAFNSEASFVDARFAHDAVFIGATFDREAWFTYAIFMDDVRFNSATFAGDARFDGVAISTDAPFAGATFIRQASFIRAAFARDDPFKGATFTRGGPFVEAGVRGDADQQEDEMRRRVDRQSRVDVERARLQYGAFRIKLLIGAVLGVMAIGVNIAVILNWKSFATESIAGLIFTTASLLGAATLISYIVFEAMFARREIAADIEMLARREDWEESRLRKHPSKIPAK